MLERARGTLTIDGTVEDIYGGPSGATRIAHISQTCVLAGGLEGESIAEYSAVLPRDGNGSFQGFQRISGKLGEREGSFVVSVTGSYHRGQPRGQWTIVPKSGAGDFVHIRGQGDFDLPPGKPGSYRLEFDLRKPRSTRTAASSEAPTLETASTPPAAETIAIEPAVPDSPARRSRRAKPETAAANPPQPAGKPARRKQDPLPEPTEPMAVAADQPDSTSKPRRQPKSASKPTPQATVPAELEPRNPAKTAAKRTRSDRKPPAQAPSEPAAAPVAPASSRPRKRAHETDPELAPAVPEPVPLSIADAKPARQRRSRAA